MDTHGRWRYKTRTSGERPTMSFGTLLYRYFFFGWLFKDASRGNVLERAAAWRHNREQARWLPTYMRRWLWCGLACYALGVAMESLLHAPDLSVVFYIACAIAVPVNAVIGAAWVGLRVAPVRL